ncbi:hypothetical protein PF008_g12358 [Phytophthora fragariae]|uniref:Uncharacterized protein n=1 Tax=Phytophthora fragariae TaxID=53985 RepID=A0A6G0RP10_9STRA|nr:hypothetical protein PF008_g12358 [Phytophthora fragariae]
MCYTKGYVVFYGAVHDDKINVWLMIACLWRSIARIIDGWFEEEVTDMTEEQVRVKAAVPSQDAPEISRSFTRIYRMFYPAGSAQDWIFMKTPAGTKVQPPHRDVLTVPQGADIMDVSSLSGPIVVPHYDRPHDHRPTVVTEIDDTRGIANLHCGELHFRGNASVSATSPDPLPWHSLPTRGAPPRAVSSPQKNVARSKRKDQPQPQTDQFV